MYVRVYILCLCICLIPIYTYIRTWVYVCMYLCMYVHTYLPIYTYIRTWANVCMYYVCTYIHVRVCTCMFDCIYILCVYVRIHVCMFVCMHVRMYDVIIKIMHALNITEVSGYIQLQWWNFLLQITLLTEKGSTSTKLDKVFEAALYEMHNSLVSNYSLTLQVSPVLFRSVQFCMSAIST